MGSRSSAPLGSRADSSLPCEGILSTSRMQTPGTCGLRPAPHPLDRTRRLLADLPSQVMVGSQVRYELYQFGLELQARKTRETYRWTLIDRQQCMSLYSTVSSSPQWSVQADRAGAFRVQVELLLDGQSSQKRWSRDLEVRAKDRQLATLMSDPALAVNEKVAYRELYEFQSFVVNSSERVKLPARFVAAVLFVEILNRWRGRDRELAQVRRNLVAQDRGDFWHRLQLLPWQRIDRSLGVGQVRLSTAAMLSGAIPWRDQDRHDRRPVRQQIARDFEALPMRAKWDLYERLRWPESNIETVAQLLSHLKNRPNRYPEMTGTEFGRDQQAVGVIATEYNAGPTDSSAADAAPSNYGRSVWRLMTTDPHLTRLFSRD